MVAAQLRAVINPDLIKPRRPMAANCEQETKMYMEASERSRKLQAEVREFMDAYVYSAEEVYERQLDDMENR